MSENSTNETQVIEQLEHVIGKDQLPPKEDVEKKSILKADLAQFDASKLKKTITVEKYEITVQKDGKYI